MDGLERRAIQAGGGNIDGLDCEDDLGESYAYINIQQVVFLKVELCCP